MPAGSLRRDDAVSPVIGTVLVLSITVLSMSLVLFWGRPALERLEAGTAANAMLGELGEVRDAHFALQGMEDVRMVSVSVPDGDIATLAGTHVLVLVTYVPNCSPTVLSWADGDAAVVAPGDGCTSSVANAYRLDGATRTPHPPLEPYTLDRDYVLEFVDGTEVEAEAFLLHSERLAWTRPGSEPAEVALDAGALLQSRGGSQRVEAGLRVGGDGDEDPASRLVLRLPMLDGQGQSLPSGTHDVELRRRSSVSLVDATVEAVRIEMSGPYSEALCSSLLLRNSFFASGATGTWIEEDGLPLTDPDSDAAEPPCDAARDELGVRYFSVAYQRPASAPDPVPFVLHHTFTEVRLAL